MAHDFARSADSNGYLRKIDSAGTVRIYDPATNTFGAYNPDGSIRTFFKPDPAGHPYPTN